MDQEEDIYVTPKASSVKNGKSSPTAQNQVACQRQEKELLQDHLLARSEKKTAQRGPSKRVSVRLATKESLQAVTPTLAQSAQKQRQTTKDLSFILLKRMEELVTEVKDLRKEVASLKGTIKGLVNQQLGKGKQPAETIATRASFVIRFKPYFAPLTPGSSLAILKNENSLILDLSQCPINIFASRLKSKQRNKTNNY